MKSSKFHVCIEPLEGRLFLDGEQHTGTLVGGAFGGGTTTTPTAPLTLHQITIPDSTPKVADAVLGTFGGTGNAAKLVQQTQDGTTVTFTLTGGTATAYSSVNGMSLVITDGGKGCTLTVATRGGSGMATLTDVTVTGTLKSMTARSSDLSGTLYASGAIGKLILRNITGTIASGAGSIAGIQAVSMTTARVFSGANFGADGLLGGTGTDADTYGAGSIGTIQVSGPITSSIIGAGLNPVNSIFLDSDDVIVGGTSSSIKSIVAASASFDTRFIAGAFGTAKLGAKVAPATDSRFATS